MMKYRYSKTIFILILSVLISAQSFSSNPNTNITKPLVVVIDPGHGGKDPGAVSKGIREKDVVLAIGRKLGKYINESYPDVKVVFTRSSDVFVPLIDRSKIANKNKANLFISLHANFCGTPATRGTETFVLGLHRSDDNLEVAKKENSVILLEDDYSTTYEGFDPNLSESYIMFELTQDIFMDQSLLFADAIQQQFKAKLDNPNRGVKQAGFLVLRQSSMPSVLVEAGFLSNASEANYLNSDAGQTTIAQSVFEAFKHFKNKNAGPGNNAVAENNKNTPAVAEPKKQVSEAVVLPVVKAENKLESENQKAQVSAVPVTEKQNQTAEVKTEVRSETFALETKEIKPETKQVTAGNTYFSVQIGANTTPVEPNAANFKGLKDVRREKTDKYYRYYVGKENSIEQITPIWQQIKQKFPQAFIVSFVDGNRKIIQ
jgi:N-acetylmuramoyl-L-alanine amidase